MGDVVADVRVRTRYTDRETLITAVGRSIEHGRIRVPMLIERGRAFELTITTRGGAIAVKGAAEVVAHDNGSTWVRYVSANEDQTDHGIRFDLNDAEVIVPATLLHAFRANPEPPSAPTATEIARGTPLPAPLPRETALGTRPPPRPQPPIQTPVPVNKASGVVTRAAVAEPSSPIPVPIKRDSPTAAVRAVLKTKLTPVLIASIAIAVAGAIVAISAVIWARSAIDDKPAPAAALAAAASCPPADEAPATVATTPSATPARTMPATAKAPTEAAPSGGARCTVNVSASADNVAIWIDGESHGTAPATLSLPCEPVTIAMRHPRYEDQSRKIEPTAKGASIAFRMQRPKATLKVVSRPAGAVVTVRGRVVGKTPITTSITGFETTSVSIAAPNMVTVKRKVYAKGSTTVAVTLKKKRR